MNGENTKAKWNIWGVVIGVMIIAIAVLLVGAGYYLGKNAQKSRQEKVFEEKIEQIYTTEELSEWDILQMAIMKTESEFDPSRIGATNDVGAYQITPIFVEEVNRILRMEESNELEYSHLDAFDVRKSIEMFNIVQNYHNKELSIAKAINVQNPGGASIGYGKKVYDNIRFIKRMEDARKELIAYQIETKLAKE